MSIYYVSTELSHHGVKGQKWGVRKEQKYQAKSDKWAKREAKARTSFGKNYASDMRIYYKYGVDQQRAENNSKGIKEKLRQRSGAEASERVAKMRAEQYSARASRAKSDKKQAKLERAAYNNASMARHYKNVSQHSNSTIKRAMYSNKTIMKTPLKNIRTGKQTTYGKEFAKAFAITAAYTLATSAAQMYMEDKM